jgi:hypothetical protein
VKFRHGQLINQLPDVLAQRFAKAEKLPSATGCLSASECACELGNVTHWLASSQWHPPSSFD